jgi:hypothetical protein
MPKEMVPPSIRAVKSIFGDKTAFVLGLSHTECSFLAGTYPKQ